MLELPPSTPLHILAHGENILVVSFLVLGRAGTNPPPTPQQIRVPVLNIYLWGTVKIRYNGRWTWGVSHFGYCNCQTGSSSEFLHAAQLVHRRIRICFWDCGVIIWTSALNSAVKTCKYVLAESFFGLVLVNGSVVVWRFWVWHRKIAPEIKVWKHESSS